MLVARALNARGIATLLFDLLTPAEEEDRVNVFDIRFSPSGWSMCSVGLIATRSAAKLPLGLFGASTGAAAALVAAARFLAASVRSSHGAGVPISPGST